MPAPRPRSAAGLPARGPGTSRATSTSGRLGQVAVALLLGALLGALHTLPAVTGSAPGHLTDRPTALAAAMSSMPEHAAASPHPHSGRSAGPTSTPSADGRPAVADEADLVGEVDGARPATASHTGPGCSGHTGLCLSDLGPRGPTPAAAPAPALAASTVVLSQGLSASHRDAAASVPGPHPPLSRAALQVWRC